MDKSVIFDLFAGRLTLLQRKLVTDWLETPANRILYYEWLEEWERSHLQYVPDDEIALQHTWVAIEQWERQKAISEQTGAITRRLFTLPSWLVAALLVLIALAGGGYVSRSYWFYETLTTTYGEIQQHYLPDGSKVTLNANSSLLVPRFGFGRSIREVYLTGEAAFSIKHTFDNQRFVVKASENVAVVVLGTEFTVSTRQHRTKVVLNRGKIQLNYQPSAQIHHRILMKPGDLAGIDQTGRLAIRRIKNPDAHAAWQQYGFVFEKTPVGELALLLHENYNLTVILKGDDLANRTVSGSFQAKTADEFLRLLAELLEINYSQQGTTVTFFE